MASESVSNTQADQAGQRLRNARLDPDQGSEEAELTAARETVEQFRLRFLEPHLVVADTLRDLVHRLHEDVAVTARLKRYERIVDKLLRQPHMRLSQMQDIGGCRAVLPGRLDGSPGASGLDALRSSADQIGRTWGLAAEPDDYISHPRSTGYRAMHLVVREGGVSVEVQLRTFRQDQWAELVETTARRTGLGLAESQGPGDLLRLFQVASEIYAANDAGRSAPPSLQADFEGLLPALGSILKSAPPETGSEPS